LQQSLPDGSGFKHRFIVQIAKATNNTVALTTAFSHDLDPKRPKWREARYADYGRFRILILDILGRPGKAVTSAG